MAGSIPRRLSDLTLSADGKEVAAFDGKKVCLWETKSWKDRFPNGFAKADGPLAISPDGKLLASHKKADEGAKLLPPTELGEKKGGICFWETATGKERLFFQTDIVRHYFGPMFFGPKALAFAPDGKTLAEASPDCRVRLWSVATGTELCAFTGHQSEVRQLVFAPDGKSVASVGSDSTILIWDVSGVIEKRRSPALDRGDLARLWADLASADGSKAHRSLWTLVDGHRQSLPFLKEQLEKAVKPEADKVARWIADLDSDTFPVRDKAMTELEGLGEAIKADLQRTLKATSSAEVKHRLRLLLDKIEGERLFPASQQLRLLRAIEVLEHVGNAEAIKALKVLVEGAPEARLTQEAKASLERLAKRPAP
jgi:hypothetical protein